MPFTTNLAVTEKSLIFHTTKGLFFSWELA